MPDSGGLVDKVDATVAGDAADRLDRVFYRYGIMCLVPGRSRRGRWSGHTGVWIYGGDVGGLL